MTSVSSIITKNHFEISPTLVENELKVSLFANNKNSTLRISDTTGKLFRELNTKESNCYVSTGFLPVGMYLLECKSENFAQTLKFIKK
jgi:hypothetical protein